MLESQSLVLLRTAGAVFGLVLAIDTFFRFRRRRIARTEALLRWFIAAAISVAAIYPPSVNIVASILAMDSNSWGRMLALLVLSNLLLWLLFFRERSKLHRTRIDFDRLVRSLAVKGAAPFGLEELEGADVLVAMPALNEADNLPVVLRRIPKSIGDRTVRAVVIDDGSTDGTSAVARENGFAVIGNPIRRGQGAALRLAYDLAQSVGAEVVVTLDADGQHLPEEIAQVVAPILNGEKDFVIGSRLLGRRDSDSRFRLLGIHLNNLLINTLAGTRISDCSSGFKAVRVEVLDRIVLNEDQFQAAEAIMSAAHTGLRIGEVPITVKRRLTGQSKKGRDFTYGLNFTRSVFKTWWR